jgi:hypothetical protein
VSRAANFVVPRAVRTHRGCLQTAVHTWTRNDDRRTVTLVGTVHVADVAYYRTLDTFITTAEADGAVVHFEAIGHTDDDVFDLLTDHEREALKAFDRMSSVMDRLGVVVELTHQRDGLKRRDDWMNTDVTTLDLVRMLGPSKIIAMTGDASLDRLDEFAEHWLARWFVRWLLRNLGHVSWLAGRLGRSPLDSRMVLDWRNTVAATAALATPADGHVVAIWGSEHLPGIGELLVRNDFILDRVQWFTAIAFGRHRGELPQGHADQ